MAGRGRGRDLTMPAWMTAGTVPGAGEGLPTTTAATAATAATPTTATGSAAGLPGAGGAVEGLGAPLGSGYTPSSVPSGGSSASGGAGGDGATDGSAQPRKRKRFGDEVDPAPVLAAVGLAPSGSGVVGGGAEHETAQKLARVLQDSGLASTAGGLGASGLAGTSFAPGLGASAAPVLGLGASSGAVALGRFGVAPLGSGVVLGAGLGAGSSSATDPTRQARRLYVSGLSHPLTERDVKDFFDDLINKGWRYSPTGHVVSVNLHLDRNFAFIELPTMALAKAVLEQDGILFRDRPLKIRRPNDFNPATVPHVVEPSITLMRGDVISTMVPDGPNKIFIGGLPYELNEDHVRLLLEAYGKLKGLHLVREPNSVRSKGYAFAEFMDPSITDSAIGGLNDLQVGERKLTVRRAQNRSEVGGGGGGGGGMGAYGAGRPGAGLGGLGGGGFGGAGLGLGLGLGGLGTGAAGLGALGGAYGGGMMGGGMMGGYGGGGGGAGVGGGVVGYGGLGYAPAAVPTYPGMPVLGGASAVPPPPPPPPPPSSVPSMMPSGYPPTAPPVAATAPSFLPTEPPTRVLMLLNMVTPEDLKDDAEYADIVMDVQDECSKFGTVRTVVVPREGAGVGRVFVEFAAPTEATAAAKELAGRLFATRIVAARYFDEALFAAKLFG